MLKQANQQWALFNLKTDIGEQNNVSSQYPAIFKNLVRSAEHWTRNHVEPRWFHASQAEQTWDNNNMPRYSETFELND